MQVQKQLIHGIEYDVYRNIVDETIELKSKNTFLDCCKCLVVNNSNELSHVMYSNSSVSGRMKGSNKYLVSAYGQGKKYICGHVFIEPESSDVPVYKPELLVSLFQTNIYEDKKKKNNVKW